jgi:hypothetical protein
MPQQMLNFGGAHRITKTPQLDIHPGTGLNNNSSGFIIGIAYSILFDSLF